MRIMVCYDGTEPSEKAVDAAISQAEAFNGRVYLVTTLEKGGPEEQKDIDTAKKALEGAQKRVKAKGIECQTDLLIHGMNTGEDLLEFAMKKLIDLVIVGIVRKSKVGKLFFGSTAQYLILKAPCPVLTVK